MKHAKVLKMIAHHPIISVHEVGLAVGQFNTFVALNGIHEVCKQVNMGKVVRFGNPNVLAPGQIHPLFPLPEWATRIVCVKTGANSLILRCVPFYHLTAVVGGAIIKDNDLNIIVSLMKNALNPLWQKAGMVVIGNYYAYGWQI